MKTFKNRFVALVELRNVGPAVVAVKVSTTLRLDRFDGAFLSERILHELLPVDAYVHRLYDDSFVLVSDPDLPFFSNECVAHISRDFKPLVCKLDLEDGLSHRVEISFGQSDDPRRDYSVLDTRFVRLLGEVSVEVDDDEAREE